MSGGKFTAGECETCGGTGRIAAARSGFEADGVNRLNRLNCGICAGTGRSGYKPNPEYARFQRKHRAAIARASGDAT